MSLGCLHYLQLSQQNFSIRLYLVNTGPSGGEDRAFLHGHRPLGSPLPVEPLSASSTVDDTATSSHH
jgi:hypothetical protein